MKPKSEKTFGFHEEMGSELIEHTHETGHACAMKFHEGFKGVRSPKPGSNGKAPRQDSKGQGK